MNQDEDLAAALKQAAAGLPVGPPPVDTVVRLGRGMRRRRRTALATALAAAVLVPATAMAALSLDPPGSGAPAVPAASAAASPHVRVVGPGEKIAPGRGNTLWLTAQGLFLGTPESSGPAGKPALKAAEVPHGAITGTTFVNTSGTLHAGIYRGPDKAVGITTTIGGRTVATQVITLAGSPGWTAFYADDTEQGATSPGTLTVTVRAADGTVLASLTKSTRG